MNRPLTKKRQLLLLLLGAAASGSPLAALANSEGPDMAEQLQAWAGSGDPADLARLRQALAEESTLRALDALPLAAASRAGPRSPTVYDKLFAALAQQPAGAELLTDLISDAASATRFERSPRDPMSSLLRASLRISEPSERLLTAWRRQARPAAGRVTVLIDGLVDHPSKPATALLLELLSSKAHSQANKVDWMHASYVPRRASAWAMASAQQVCQAAQVPAPVRLAAVEALFAPDASVWFTPGTWPQAPVVAPADPDALRTARATTAKAALGAGLPIAPALRAALELAASGR